MLALVRREWSLALALVVALALRTSQLGAQIFVGDEWHALEKAASASWTEIATSFGMADHSIPIALYYRALASTVGLNDAWIRLPFLLSGLALVAGASLCARRLVARPAADTLAWLLAVAPVLVFYSRFARPYALTCLLALGALLFFRAWWHSGKRAPALGFVVSVALAGWLHLAILPFALAPFGVYALRAAFEPGERRRRWLALARLAALTGLALAVLLLPPFLLDEGLAGKSGWGLPKTNTIVRAAHLFAGLRSGWLALCLLPFFVIGAVHLVSRARDLVVLLALAGAAQCAAVAVIAPAMRSDVFAFARYLLPLLPPALLALACGIHVLLARAGSVSAALAGPLCGGLLLALGPLPAVWFRPDNWSANHLVFHMLGIADVHVGRIPAVPAFYLELAGREPDSLTLIEAPWFPPIFANPLPHYQRVHRQRVRIGFTGNAADPKARKGQLPYPAPGFALDNFVFLEDLLGPDTPTADFLVLHRDLRREYRMETAPFLLPMADEQHEDIAPLVERARQRFGAPAHEDEFVVVFRLR